MFDRAQQSERVFLISQTEKVQLDSQYPQDGNRVGQESDCIYTIKHHKCHSIEEHSHNSLAFTHQRDLQIIQEWVIWGPQPGIGDLQHDLLTHQP